MFGNLMGNLEEKRQEMKLRLSQIKVNAESSDGLISIKANAAREIEDVKIDPDILENMDVEQLEDMILVTFNKILDLAAAKEAEETQKLIQDMLPPGMGNLGGLFS